VVLEQGQVIEQGTHEALLADPHGVYARYYRLQGRHGLGVVETAGADGGVAAQNGSTA
jgi:ATP-binding cassette subfamily B protein